MSMWKNKKVLVTGSEGMIGRELCKLLINLGCEVKPVDYKLCNQGDLTNYENCEMWCSWPDYIFHLAGIKGSPKMTKERPVDFMGPMLQFDTNMILASQQAGVKRFLYTSSIAVENPESDKYPAWAKQTAEKLLEAMKIQYPDFKTCIVRPANVYGKESLDREDLMVVSSLIKKGLSDGKLVMDREGAKQIRDLIHAKDVARGMIKAMEELPGTVNLCSGQPTQISEIADLIASELKIPIEETDLNLTLGPSRKVMKDPYIKPEVKLGDGIKEIVHWHTKKR